MYYFVKSVCCFVHTMSYYVKRLCYHDKRTCFYVHTVSYYVKRILCYVKLARCFVHTESYYVKGLCYYVQNCCILSTKHVNLSIQHVIMLNAYVVWSKQCPIMLKWYVIMLNARAVLSKQCPVMLKCYLIMFKNGLSTKHVNLSINRVIMSHTRVVLFTHVIMLKKLWFIHNAIMLNICVVLSKQCLIMLKGYVIMLRNPVILFMKHVNLSVNELLC